MYVLGINGGLDIGGELLFELPTAIAHDASAVLLEDGRIVAAAEEERPTRVKHSNRTPLHAAACCLKSAGVSFRDVDLVAVYANESFLNALLFWRYVNLDKADRDLAPAERLLDVRALLSDRFSALAGEDIGPKLRFIDHHVAHAQSAYAFSGYDEALVVTLDGGGDPNPGLVATAAHGRITRLADIVPANSLGMLYVSVIEYLGFRLFDEYKVMGLAPYGDARRFAAAMKSIVTLGDEGDFSIAPLDVRLGALAACCGPRKKGQPIEQHHKDLAAALQARLEDVALHLLAHYRRKTSLSRLCLAGGVAQNCTMNGRIARSGLFDSVFVQPAAHDSGCALGAAMQAYLDAGGEFTPQRLGPLYLGHDAVSEDIPRILRQWSDFLYFEKLEHLEVRAAELLADGHVLGWVQGRSEFGPRALGNRSIIADPRPAGNRERINAMVKKREGFRPFAPSVLEEAMADYFEIPAGTDGLPYMIFVVNVKREKRALLGAVTHVDGSARVQAVSASDNPRYWRLISEFGNRTGVPVILNTSLNNDVEPIVDTVADAVVCYLTTEIDYLVVGDYLATKRHWTMDMLEDMLISVPPFVLLHEEASVGPGVSCFLTRVGEHHKRIGCSRNMHDLLTSAAGQNGHGSRLGDLLSDVAVAVADRPAVLNETYALWTRRLVVLAPAA